ncbi:hypothetical protein CVT25_003087 [Psilocybe cyanescens]|uniref:Nephrocystin 3-like N-terminal domain-containing protein n=1 Tax=Psilocybe cyanescens TaxID=93625 RepID=A0A409XQW1_PSICY|nr:hypothetical protein CVT25_003087 [Psilocybe cyanescens]
MFRAANNVFINGGTFMDQHHQSTSFTVRGMSISWLRLTLLTSQFMFLAAIDRLMEAASLGALHNSGERFDPPKCHPNTRTAVLQKLMDWFIGVFGWDNLAIAQTFAELCAAKNRLLASFFFSRSDLRRNNEKAFVATLAYQLWLHIPESRPIVEAVINNNPAIFQLNFDTQFRTLFLEPLLQLSSAGGFTSGTPFPKLIIIDGLDECNGADIQNTILNTISNALQHHPLALPFRLLIASRPEYHLATSFSVAPLSSLTFRLALDDTYRPDEDVRLYLTDSFRDIRKTHIMRTHLPDSWPSWEDITKLVAKSSGQFIYAATVIKYVSSPRRNPLDRLKIIQGLLPVNDDMPYAQLDSLYINILSEVEDINAVLQILGTVFVLTNNTDDSIEPLRLNGLEKFMQLTPGTLQLLLLDVLSVVDASDNNKPIKFLHASFSDLSIQPGLVNFSLIPVKGMRKLPISVFLPLHLRSISYIALNIARSVQDYAYWSLLKHLRLAGPLHDNATLREKVFKVPYLQKWRRYAATSFDGSLGIIPTPLKPDPVMFLQFLQTSNFRQTEELYLHHRGIFDQQLCDYLEKIPVSPCLAFWTAVCAGGILVKHKGAVSLHTFSILSSFSAPAVLANVPALLFSATFDQIDVVNWLQKTNWYTSYPITNIPYLRMVMKFLRDPSRAGPYAIDLSTYTMAAVFAVEFLVRDWGGTKFTALQAFNYEEWGFIWDAFAFTLSKAGYSTELVNMLGQQKLSFNLGRPSTNVRHRVQTLLGAVRNYLLKFKWSSPSPFKIIMNWRGYPIDSSDYVITHFTADDLYDNYWAHHLIYIDESVLSNDEDVQEPAEKKRMAL